MCNCKKEDCKKTPYCNNFCDCVDWSDAEEWVRHIHESLIIERDVLTYDSHETLESSPAVLCVLGKCKKCGKQICFGGALEDVKTFDALMERMFRDVFCCDKDDETKTKDTVISLLHEADRDRALDWVYMNHGKIIDSQFGGINPEFNERVRHIPGHTLEIMKNLYTGLGPDDADLFKIAELSTSDIDCLREQHSIRVKREIEIAEKIIEYSRMWNRYALETRMFGDAIDVAVAERAGNTVNQWVESADGSVSIHEISNAVYKMKIWAYSPEPNNIGQVWSVWWELTLNVPYKIFTRLGTETIANGRKKRIYCKEDAEKYITGRKKANAKYFTEEYPPVPKEYVMYFSIDGVILPEYTVQEAK